MRILYLVADGPHAHGYGEDFLLAGLYNTFGADSVFDFPEKDCVHLPSIEARDDCQLASDQCLPRKNFRIEDIAPHCDLAILTAPDPRLYYALSLVPSTVPIVAVDFGDALGDFKQRYEDLCRRRVAMYYKRELPLGASFALPMPLSFPESRVPNPLPEKKNRIFYHATSHGGGDPGKPRLRMAIGIALSLRCELGTELTRSDDGLTVRVQHPQADIWLTPGQARGTRPSPEQYHAELAKSLIGIHYNCAPNFDALRFHENFAFGLCQVAERPRIQMLNMPEDSKHCVYVDKPEDVPGMVLELLQDEPRARQIAAAGRELWSKHHSSERQAERIVREVGKLGS